MKTYRIALVGLGNVGQALVQILHERGAGLAQSFGANFVLTAVSDLKLGCVLNAEGINLAELLEAISGGSLKKMPGAKPGMDAQAMLEACSADILAEASFTNLETGEPASGYVLTALKRGMHVVTSNKGPVALKYATLSALACSKGLELGVEGTVMSGTPAIRVGMELLASAGIRRVQGILNGTTNYILSQMDDGADYEDAIQEAQVLGYAEADPRGDVEGFDAAAKVVILANLLMGEALQMSDVAREGITRLTARAIAEAHAAGERWKLIGTLERKLDGSVHASVGPERIPLTHPLASIKGATNAITYTTDLLGEVTLVGPGAGRLETGYALLSDMLAIHRKLDA